MRVLAALSGGVDSAAAAARAVDAGHEVVDVHMALLSQPQECRISSRGCCPLEDAVDAARTAEVMGTPFYAQDLAEDLKECVIADFVEQYAPGRTPNPCARCNELVKFREFAQRARALGFDAVCTGHYVSIRGGESGCELYRGTDPLKDQSYVLAVMGREELSRVILPLGEVATKAEVRAEARARGLGVLNKPDSHDICFIPDRGTQGFLRIRLGLVLGDVVTSKGELVSHHDGYWNFTAGQRRGLRLKNPAADGHPRHVIKTHPDTNQVIVGTTELLSVEHIEANDAVWLAEDNMAEERRNLFIQVCTHGVSAAVSGLVHEDREAARVMGVEGGILVSPAEPIRGVAAGQSPVVYCDSRASGGGTILRTSRG